MKAYYYTPQECGLSELPDGAFTLDDKRIPRTTDPADADIFVCPVMIHHMGTLTGRGECDLTRLKSLPYIDGNEARHVFFNCGDTFLTAVPGESVIFRGDATLGLKYVNPRTYNLPWPAKDANRPEFKCIPPKFDVSFIGWASTPLTQQVAQSCVDAGLRCDIELYNEFFGYIERDDPERAQKMWDRYTRSINQSTFALCPRSIPEGVIRYRFFEAMSAGCIPVLHGDGTLFPWLDRIGWNKACIQMPEAHAGETGAILTAWLERTDEIEERRHYTQWAWRNFIDSRHWVRLATDTVITEMEV